MILLIGPKERDVVEMDETQVRAAATSLALLSNKRGHDVNFKKELCDTGAATAVESLASWKNWDECMSWAMSDV